MNIPHPTGVKLGEVIVDRDYVCTFTTDGIQVRRQRSNQRLPFTGAHLCDLALVKNDSTDQLHVERSLTVRASRSLSNRGKCLRK